MPPCSWPGSWLRAGSCPVACHDHAPCGTSAVACSAHYCRCTQQEQVLLRAMLARNSRKMQPSAWQRCHVPLHRSSPWMATYIAPHYVDRPATTAEAMERSGLAGRMQEAQARAAAAAAAAGELLHSAGTDRSSGSGSAAGPSRSEQIAAAFAAASATAVPKPHASSAEAARVGSAACAHCGAIEGKQRRCGGCKLVHYCRIECQKADWKEHKAVCKQ